MLKERGLIVDDLNTMWAMQSGANINAMLTCSMARTAFVQAPQGHRSYFACQDCTCICRKKENALWFFEHFCMHVFHLFIGMYGLSLFFLNMEPPALALAVLDLTMTGVFFLSPELKCNDGIWLYDERTPDRKRNFWSSLLLKRRSWGGKSTDVQATYDLKQKLGWCQNCWRMKLSFPMMVKKSPVARNLSLVWVSCHIQGGSFFTSPQSPPSFLPSLGFPLFSCFAFFTSSGSFHCQSAARL